MTWLPLCFTLDGGCSTTTITTITFPAPHSNCKTDLFYTFGFLTCRRSTRCCSSAGFQRSFFCYQPTIWKDCCRWHVVSASGDHEQGVDLLVVHQHTLRPHGSGAYHPTPHPYGILRERCRWLSILHDSKPTSTCRRRNYRVLIGWFNRHPAGSRRGQRGAAIQTQLFERKMLCFSRRWCDCDNIWTSNWICVTTPDIDWHFL